MTGRTYRKKSKHKMSTKPTKICTCIHPPTKWFKKNGKYFWYIIHEPEPFIVVIDDKGNKHKIKSLYGNFIITTRPAVLIKGLTTKFILK